MDLSIPGNLQATGGLDMDVGTVQKPGCKRHNAGAKGRDAGSRSRIKPLAPMGTCIGANGAREPCPAVWHSSAEALSIPWPIQGS